MRSKASSKASSKTRRAMPVFQQFAQCHNLRMSHEITLA